LPTVTPPLPLHLNDPNPHPVTLDISGSINSFELAVPTFASITVSGDAYNFGFSGRNLSVNQTTFHRRGRRHHLVNAFSDANQNITLGIRDSRCPRPW